MSISPVDASSRSVAQDPSPVVGKASPVKDPIVSSGTPASAAVSDSEVSKAVEAIQNSGTFRNSALTLSMDKESGITVFKVTDSKTDEVIRQIPTPEILEMAHSIDQTLRGKLINDKA